MRQSESRHIAQNLMPGERLIHVARIHPLIMLPPAALAACSLLAALIGLAIPGGGALTAIGLVTCACALVAVSARGTGYLTTEYGCTDRRIVIKSGFLTTRVQEMPLTKVEGLVVVQPLLGKALGYGTLVLTGSGSTRRRCESIEDAQGFYRKVQEQVALAQGTARP